MILQELSELISYKAGGSGVRSNTVLGLNCDIIFILSFLISKQQQQYIPLGVNVRFEIRHSVYLRPWHRRRAQ